MNKAPLRFAFLFSLLSASAAACLAGTPESSPGLRPAQGCNVGDLRHTSQEKWIYARGFGDTGNPAVQEYRIVEETGPASAVRVAMNTAALGNVDRVEVQDAKGNWERVWSGRTAAPAGCAEAWLEHPLAGAPRVVKAIRFGFVLDRMPMTVGHAGLRIAE